MNEKEREKDRNEKRKRAHFILYKIYNLLN